MNAKYKYLIKNIGLLTIGSFSSKILVFLLVPLYTNYLTTSEYGSYDLIITTINLLLPIITLNIADGVMRYLMDKNSSIEQTITIGIKYLISGCCIFAFLNICNKNFGFAKFLSGYEMLALLYYVCFSSYNFLMQVAKGLEKVKEITIAGILSTITTLSLNIAFLVIFNLGIKGFFIANIIGNFVPSVYLFVKISCWKIRRISYGLQ